MIALRDYQREAIDAVYSWFENKAGNPLIVVPTGGGKSVIMAEFISEVLQTWKDERILVATHVKELIDQNHRALIRSWPQAPAGVYSAGLKRREARARVVFAGVQSIFRRASELGWFDLMLVDEAHLIPSKGMGMYRTLISDLKLINPSLKLIGFTATPFRTDTGRLDEGDLRMFDGVAYDTDIKRLIDAGWLSNLTNRGVKAKIDTAGVHTQMGEFVQSELEDAATREDLVPRAVEELVARAEGRKGWLVFCCGINHATLVAGELEARGISCATVFGETPNHERDRLIKRFRAGEIQAIANVGVLTTGFDAPHVDLIALMRPTKSPGLYVQMVGRGLRIAPGKTDCLVLDFGGNIVRHGPIDDVQPVQTESSEEKAKECKQCLLIYTTAHCPVCGPIRQCGNKTCACFFHVDDRICPKCGWVVPVAKPRDPNHDTRVDETSNLLIGKQEKGIKPWKVERVTYAEHRKAGAPPNHPLTLRVTYFCGWHRTANEFICFEHAPGTFARSKAMAWWRRRGGRDPVPETVDLARVRIELGELYRPLEIIVDDRGQYPEIKGVKLDDDDHEAAARADLADAAQEPKPKLPTTDYGDIPF